MKFKGNFNSIYAHGFVRTSVCIPQVRVADPAFNLESTIEMARRASIANATLALFPELGISAYSNEDLHQQNVILDATLDAIEQIVKESVTLTPVLLVSAPLRNEGALFNCGIVVYRGKILGVAPKSYLPNYREFYERRQFTSGREAVSREITLLGEQIPFGNDLVFDAANIDGFSVFVECCEDVWTPIPPSTYGAMAGATILANHSASNITIGKADYRRNLCMGQSGRCLAAYLYSAAGPGESTTDVAWDGHAIICENGELLAEAERFPDQGQMITADIDVGRLLQERMRQGSFHDSISDCRPRIQAMRHVRFEYQVPVGDIPLQREISRFPYVPSDPKTLNERCFETYNIQVHALMKRIASSGIKRLVIGVSGGLDSTQALIVAAKTMDRLGLPRENILAYTLPGFATSNLTYQNACKLMQALRVSAGEIDIRPGCMQMFKDIGHPYAKGAEVYDSTFENVQAGERTSVLFRLANQHNAMVLGTGDLSELAQGWCTYGVGDHMSHYNVNASLPKTLIQHVLRWVASSHQFDDAANRVIESVLATEISPELIPAKAGEKDKPTQKTADKVGPYELQDFNLYYLTRFGFKPSKIAFLARHSWGDRSRGSWPPLMQESDRNEYSLALIKHWMTEFLGRFFRSQFKRSVAVNGTKVGSGGSLSPRGDWRAPSDAEARAWLDEAGSVPE